MGVLTSSTLTWSKQVDHLCNKDSKMLGYVRRSTSNIKDATVRSMLRWYIYVLMHVRSKLCYRSQIWAPQSVTSIKRVERLQRRATKYILNLPFCCDTSCNQRPLIMTYYSLHAPSNNRRETRSSDLNHMTLTTTKCKTTTYQRSFLNRTKKEHFV